MANAMKCDRCGRFYIIGDKEEFVDNPKFELKSRSLAWIEVFDVNDNRIGIFDLCDDCAKKLYEFLCGNEVEG